MTGWRTPPRRGLPPMSDAHHAAITAELVRLTLGGRPARPELADWQRHAIGQPVRIITRSRTTTKRRKRRK